MEENMKTIRFIGIVLAFLIPTYAQSIDKDTCNFVDLNQYEYILNKSENDITIDSIQIMLLNQNRYFNVPIYHPYCFINRHKFRLTMLPDSTFNANYDTGVTKLTILKKDSLKFNFTISIPWVYYNYGPGYLIDTLKVRFKSSDNSSDTIIAISRITYASSIKNVKTLKKNIISDIKNKNELLLNGKIISKNKLSKNSNILVGNRDNRKLIKIK